MRRAGGRGAGGGRLLRCSASYACVSYTTHGFTHFSQIDNIMQIRHVILIMLVSVITWNIVGFCSNNCKLEESILLN